MKNGKIVSSQIGIQNNGTLSVDCEIESASSAINSVFSGVATIEGGSYKSTSIGNALIVSNVWGQGNPQLTINGGTFESPYTNVSFNNGSTGAVNAGTFKCTGVWHNIYVGGSEGSCNVTYSADKCTFESNGIKIVVDDWNAGKTNTVNGVSYSTDTTNAISHEESMKHNHWLIETLIRGCVRIENRCHDVVSFFAMLRMTLW